MLMDTNWGGDAEPVTNYYFDEIALNNNPLPRGVNILPDTQMSLFLIKKRWKYQGVFWFIILIEPLHNIVYCQKFL